MRAAGRAAPGGARLGERSALTAKLDAREGDHRVANGDTAHRRTDGHDVAGEFATEDLLARRRDAEGEPTREPEAPRHAEAANPPVGRGHGGGAHVDQEVVRAGAGSRDVLHLHHPRSRINVGPNMLRYIEATRGALRGSGLSWAETDRAWNTMDNYIFGYTLRPRKRYPGPPRTRTRRRVTLGRTASRTNVHVTSGVPSGASQPSVNIRSGSIASRVNLRRSVSECGVRGGECAFTVPNVSIAATSPAAGRLVHRSVACSACAWFTT
jgi:hypothetical protein